MLKTLLTCFKCFGLKILDYYNITVQLLVCNKLSVSKMRGATIKLSTNKFVRLPKDVRKCVFC
jgi:hypothetical protein